MKRALLFLYSTPNIVGSALGLVGLGLFFAGIIKSLWVFIVVGLYLVGWLGTPRSPTYKLALSNELTIDQIQKELDRLIGSVRNKLSPEVVAKLESIEASIVAVLPRLPDLNGASHDAHVVEQTAMSYLPEMLEHYLNLPRAFARLHPVKDGKTARQLLLEQLELLDEQMKKIVVDINRNDTEALVTHGRFLKKKFATGESWLA